MNDRSQDDEFDYWFNEFEIWCDIPANHRNKIEEFVKTRNVPGYIAQRLFELGRLDELNPSFEPLGSSKNQQSLGQMTSDERFVITGDEIGSGGLGVVYPAQDSELNNRVVVIKKIAENRAMNPEIRQRFFQEAKITAELGHPGVAPVFGMGITNDKPFYAMKLIEGETLEEAICSKSHEQRQLLRRFCDVCQTILFAHSQPSPVIHRDIKPGNIVLGDYGESVVIDWGLAKRLDAEPARESSEHSQKSLHQNQPELSVDGRTMGTPQFMSPEQAAGDWRNVGPHSDIYSLGAVLTNIVTGQVPVKGNDVKEVIRNVKSGNVITLDSRPTNVPRAIWSICKKAMSLVPDERYSCVDALRKDVDAYLDDKKIAAHKESSFEYAQRWLRNHPHTTVALIMATVFLVIGLVGLGIFTQKLNAARQLADENFEAAKQAVNTYMVQVTENKDLRDADFFELRKSLLESAIPFYERLKKQGPDKGKISFGQADATFRLARLEEEMGNSDQAEELYQEAISSLRVLSANSKLDKQVRIQLARSLNNLALLKKESEELDNAKSLFEESLAVKDQLVKEFPTDEILFDYLASTHHNLGKYFQDIGNDEEANNSYGCALEIQREVCERVGSHPKFLHSLAQTLRAKASFDQYRNQLDSAAKLINEAEAIQRQIMNTDPKDPYYQSKLCSILQDSGSILAAQDNFTDAIQKHIEAVTVGMDLSKRFLNKREFQYDYLRAKSSLGSTQFSVQQFDKAKTNFLDSLAIRKNIKKNFTNSSDLDLAEAILFHNLGNIEWELQNLAEAKKNFNCAKRLFQKVAKKSPQSVGIRHKLAGCCNQIGTIERIEGRLNHARRNIEFAIGEMEVIYEKSSLLSHGLELARLREGMCSICQQIEPLAVVPFVEDSTTHIEKLFEEAPQNKLTRLLLAANYVTRANLCSDFDPKQAIRWYDKGIPVIAPLSDDAEVVPDFNNIMTAIHVGKANSLRPLARYQEASDQWKLASGYADDNAKNFCQQAAKKHLIFEQMTKEFDALIAKEEKLYEELENKAPEFLVEFAEFCSMAGVRQFALSAKVYRLAFSRNPSMADPVGNRDRYYAAASAALAAEGKGIEVELLGNDGQLELRNLARKWMEADLGFYRELNVSESSTAFDSLQAVSQWFINPAFESVRDKTKLLELSVDEQNDWFEFWINARSFLDLLTRQIAEAEESDN